jgi:hypothetical protein
MIALVLAGIVLGATALVITRNRRRPDPKPVRIETKDRKDRLGR